MVLRGVHFSPNQMFFIKILYEFALVWFVNTLLLKLATKALPGLIGEMPCKHSSHAFDFGGFICSRATNSRYIIFTDTECGVM